MINIRYIEHSGFLVETNSRVLIFDYYKGSLPLFDTSKPVIVFSSHAHSDHYNPDIFKMLRDSGAGNIIAVLSSDIPEEKLPADINVVIVRPDEEHKLSQGEKICTFTSTDEGVAFLVETDEGVFFHSGDLNDWRWEGESDQYNDEMVTNFRKEIDKLKNIHIDHAFIPLDPRQEKYTGEGLLYFIRNVSAANVYPMHFWNKPDIIKDFINRHPEVSSDIRDVRNL